MDYDTYEKRLINPSTKKATRITETDECPICYDLLSTKPIVYIESCSHVFCYNCLRTWMNAARNKPCPTCRTAIAEFTVYDKIDALKAPSEIVTIIDPTKTIQENIKFIRGLMTEYQGSARLKVEYAILAQELLNLEMKLQPANAESNPNALIESPEDEEVGEDEGEGEGEEWDDEDEEEDWDY